MTVDDLKDIINELDGDTPIQFVLNGLDREVVFNFAFFDLQKKSLLVGVME